MTYTLFYNACPNYFLSMALRIAKMVSSRFYKNLVNPLDVGYYMRKIYRSHIKVFYQEPQYL